MEQDLGRAKSNFLNQCVAISEQREAWLSRELLVLYMMIHFADLKTISVCPIYWGKAADERRWCTPHCFKNVSNVENENWGLLLLDIFSETPKVINNSRRRLISSSDFDTWWEMIDFNPAAESFNCHKVRLFISFDEVCARLF